MRRALVILGALALVAIFVWVSVAPPGPVASPSPTPTATAGATPTQGASPTPAGSPVPPPTGTAVAFGPPVTHDDITVRAAAATPGTDIHYITTRDSSAKTWWVLLLDLGAKRAQTVAEVEIAVPEGAQAAPGVFVTWSTTGEHVLIFAHESGPEGHFFAVDVRQGSARHLVSRSSTAASGVISPDGTQYAFSDAGDQGGQAGLFVAPTAGGEARRVIVTDPQRVGGPPFPIAFSPNGVEIAARVTTGGQRAIAIVPTTGNEARYTGELEGGVLLEPGSDFSWAGAPDDAWAWDPVDALGGSNSVLQFDTRSGRGVSVYAPQSSVLQDFGRNPSSPERFFTIEGQGVIGAGPRAIWVRTRQGGQATKVADLGETGPHEPWWSADGRRLYALTSEDDSVGTVIDVLTGETILSYCHRGPTGAGPCV